MIKCSLCGCLQEDNMKTCVSCHAIFREKEEIKEEPKKEIKKDLPRGIVPYTSVVGFVLSFFNPILGIIFSSIGISRAKKTNAKKAFGVLGLIISIVEIALIVAFAALFLEFLQGLLEAIIQEIEAVA